MTNNQIQYWNAVETKRNNQVTEAERERNNRALERIQGQANDIKYQLGIQQNTETQRANMAKEQENTRTNLANELIKREANTLRGYEIGVAARNAEINQQNADTNRMQIGLGYSTLAETQRANMARESLQQEELGIKRDTQEETVRTNKANEDIKRFGAVTSYGTNKTNAKTNIGTLEESIRTHKANEGITRENNLYNAELRSLELQSSIELKRAELMQKAVGSVLSNVNSYGTKLVNPRR